MLNPLLDEGNLIADDRQRFHHAFGGVYNAKDAQYAKRYADER